MGDLINILWIVLAVVGAATVWLGLRGARRSRATWEWPTTTATLTSEVREPYVQVAADTPPDTVHMGLWYEYTVDGKEFTRYWHVIVGDTNDSDAVLTRRFKNHFKEGREFPLIYDPDNPDRVHLQGPQAPAVGRVIAIFGALGAAEGLLLWVTDPVWPVIVAPAVVAAVVCLVAMWKTESPSRPKPNEFFDYDAG